MTTVDCEEWTGAFAGSGYGTRWVAGRGHVSAHRYAWELAHGPIPDGLFVLHHCDNKRCVRVEHLFLGTPADNMHDMDRKGRRRVVSTQGEARSDHKLTEVQVREIRAMAAGGMSYRRIALRYPVHASTVERIVRRQRWAHVA